jgi:hypothetical protein
MPPDPISFPQPRVVQHPRSSTRYDNYLAWRTDSGYTAQFEDMLAQPMSIRYFGRGARV